MQETSPSDLRVGMVIQVTSGMILPADAVLLSCSNEIGAFVDTSEFDGSATLKQKIPIAATEDCNCAMDIADLRCSVTCDPPSGALDQFRGSFRFDGNPNSVNLGVNNLLLRGSVLKNTEWAFCLVVYTGTQTKMGMNNSYSAHRVATLRRSRVERFLDTGIIPSIAAFTAVFGVLLILRSSDAHVWCNVNEHFCSMGAEWFPHFLEVLLGCTQFLCLAFYFQLAVLQLYQSVRSKCRFGVASDLGQAEMCFFDKTGTVTVKDMPISMAAVGGFGYGFTLMAEMQKGSGGDDGAENGDEQVVPHRLSSTQSLDLADDGAGNIDPITGKRVLGLNKNSFLRQNHIFYFRSKICQNRIFLHQNLNFSSASLNL